MLIICNHTAPLNEDQKPFAMEVVAKWKHYRYTSIKVCNI